MTDSPHYDTVTEKVAPQTIVLLARALEDNTSLHSLELCCRFSEADMIALAQSLKLNTSLTRLRLNGIFIDPVLPLLTFCH